MAEDLKTQSFETFLVEHGFITQALFDKLKEQSKQSGEAIVDIVAKQKILSPEAFAQAKGAFLNIPYISFKDQEISDKLLEIIPRDTEGFYHLFAFGVEGNNLKVAMTDPTNIAGLEALEFFSKKKGMNIQLYITDEDSFNKVFNKNQNITSVVGEALTAIAEKEKTEKKTKEEKQGGQAPLQQLIQEAPISKIVDVILANAIDSGASDIHIEPTDKILRVRYRIDGILHTNLEMPLSVQSAVVSKIKILANLKIDESRLPQDGRFHYETLSKSVDLRVSILPNVNGEKIVMRILDKSTKVPTLEQLGFRGKALKVANENLRKTNGIFLITGPTGSGKSTTLYAMLSILNTQSVNIVTLEDPVEYFMEGVNQSQVNPDIGLTFAAGLRSILRQDPNIIMVGEVRDKETAELAVQSALTGHLVFSTLHTNSAIGALPRLIDMGIEPFLLAASINAVGAQRLCRKICPDCKKEVPVEAIVKAQILKELEGVSKEELSDVDIDHPKAYIGTGCEKCNNTGYRGRVAILEIFQINNTIQKLVSSKSSPLDIFEEAKKNGMITMKQDGVIKTMLGLTTFEEVIRVTSE